MILYQQWYQVFELNESIIDLPHLNSIKLGSWALLGRNDSSCSLLMESDIDWTNWFLDLPNLTSITSNWGSFYEPRSVTLSSLILNNWILNRYSESTNSQSSWFILGSQIQINH